jgi:hypothetical protein
MYLLDLRAFQKPWLQPGLVLRLKLVELELLDPEHHGESGTKQQAATHQSTNSNDDDNNNNNNC